MSRRSATGRRAAAPTVRFRPSSRLEIPWVRTLERHPDVQPYINMWTERRHEGAITDPTMAHWVVEDAESGRAVGFVILSGLGTDVIEIVRIAVARRGEGYGRATLKAIQRRVFVEWGAERLWLDVYPHNTRARALYESEGYRISGPQSPPAACPSEDPEGALVVLELRSRK